MKSLAMFDRDLKEAGWTIFDNTLSSEVIQSMRKDCLKWIDIGREYQIASRINSNGDGTAHHAIGANDSIDAYIDMHLFHEYLSHYFNAKPYILHACNPVGGFPNATTYVHRMHRDVTTYIPNYNLRLNMIVMLDDFTVDNGATRVLRGSHLAPIQPSEDEFERKNEPLLGSVGSVLLFNSYLWHRGGINTTETNRVALTLSFGPAFIKPQLDYARLLGDARGKNLSELSRQVLGFNARVPTSLEEWYRPKSERLYLSNQG